MKEKESFPRLNRSYIAAALVCLGFFLLLFVCNHFTDLVADDYRYCFSYADDSRITSVADIFPSMAAHRLGMNGRVIAHFLVQLFLLLPKGVFNVVNSLFFVALVWLLHRLAVGGARPNVLLLLCVFGCLWILQPEFGQVFLWLDGSVNYLWCAVLCLLWLLTFVREFRDNADPGTFGRILFILYSFLVGAYSENATVAMVAMGLLFLALDKFYRKRPLRMWMALSLLAMLAGFLYMMSAPAETVNKSAQMTLAVLLSNFVETGLFYLRFWPLMLSYVLFYCLSVRRGVSLSERVLSLVFLFGSLAGHFVLTFAMYCAGRSTYIGLVLLIAANAVLFARLFEKPGKSPLLLLCTLCLVVTVWRVAVGVQDIRRTHILLRYNQELIEACVADGERDLQVPRPYARTKYSAMEGLAYLNTEDPNDWPNVYMAKYYGANSIIGY
ncbi:MAG: hypothetical protein IJV41_12710 [Oscillospiraceae bacterium]|nr:hypothetical protein [Oscillospiraceae bacterium]